MIVNRIFDCLLLLPTYFLAKRLMASGIVVTAPTRVRVHPIAFLCSFGSLSAISRASPAPSIARVLTISARSGKVISAFFMMPPKMIQHIELKSFRFAVSPIRSLIPILIFCAYLVNSSVGFGSPTGFVALSTVTGSVYSLFRKDNVFSVESILAFRLPSSVPPIM